MAKLSETHRDFLDGLSAEFLQHYAKGRTILAVDGLDPAATARFADDLAARLGRGRSVFRASVMHFQRPRAEQIARGEFSPEAWYRDAFDYEQLRRVLLAPFKLGGSTGFVLRAFDNAQDGNYDMAWQTGPQDSTLIIDGPFLNRPELRGGWNFSIWLDGPPAPQADAGLAARDAGANALYLADANPVQRATVVIDNTDPDDPRREWQDSC